MSDPTTARPAPETQEPRGRLGTLALYLREMFPPFPRLLLSALWFYAVYLGLASYHGETVPLLGSVPVAGTLTYFVFLLFLRLSDEWKDLEADRVHFPDRPVPSGRVSARWVRGMWGGSLVTLFLLQLPLGGPNPAFLVLVGYALLMFRYFFLERWIASHLLLAVITHNPVGILLNFYGAWTVADAMNRPPLEAVHVWLALLLWLPTLVWEVSRKIRAPNQETSYQTYSSILGPRRAAVVAAAGAALFAGVGLVLAQPVSLGVVGRVGIVVAALGFVWRCGRFAIDPIPERAALRGPAELWTVVSLAVWCLDLALVHPSPWTLL